MELTSLADNLKYEKEFFLKECDACGLCIEVCQVWPYLDSFNNNPAQLAKKIVEFLQGGENSVEVYDKIFSCSQCAACLHSCPKGLNPFLMQAVFKEEMKARGQVPRKSPQVLAIENSGHDPEDVMCGLQLRQSEIRWLTQVPSNPKQTDILLYLGCHVRTMPDKILAMLDILEQLGLNYVALAGGTTCCGQKYTGSGDIQKASDSLDNLTSALESFRPKKVIFWCGTCYNIFKHESPRFTKLPFEVQHYAQLLCDNLSEFKFKSPLNKTITVHDSCALGRKSGDYTSMRQLLEAIPGVNLVEMLHTREDALCCGGATYRHYPEVADQMRKKRMDEAKDTGAGNMVVSCQGCNRFFSRDEKNYPFEVNNFVTIFAEALGITHEDKLKKYMELDRLDDVLEAAKEYIDASPLTMEETKPLVSGFFNKP